MVSSRWHKGIDFFEDTHGAMVQEETKWIQGDFLCMTMFLYIQRIKVMNFPNKLVF